MPTSYQPPTRGDSDANRTSSQTIETNMSAQADTVAQLLAQKDSAVITVHPSDTLGDAVKLLRDKRIGALMVTNDEAELTGILSERDIVRKLAETPGQTLPQTVSDNMTKDVKTCTPEDTLVSVLRIMTEGKFRHMPVIDRGRLCGMITIGDVIQYRLKALELEALQMKQLIVG